MGSNSMNIGCTTNCFPSIITYLFKNESEVVFACYCTVPILDLFDHESLRGYQWCEYLDHNIGIHRAMITMNRLGKIYKASTIIYDKNIHN